MEDFVYLKYIGKGGSYSVMAELEKPFVFEPYCKLSDEKYYRWKSLLHFSGEILLVPQEEYDAWAQAKAAKEAELHYCGDYGGQTVAGNFCAKPVDGSGCRCEHHGGLDAAMQGHYEKTRAPRPLNINRGGRGHKKE